jgi:hypothetical protein
VQVGTFLRTLAANLAILNSFSRTQSGTVQLSKNVSKGLTYVLVVVVILVGAQLVVGRSSSWEALWGRRRYTWS